MCRSFFLNIALFNEYGNLSKTFLEADVEEIMEKRKPLALISVANKIGIADFAKRLVGLGWNIIASDGTSEVLREADVENRTISQFTGRKAVLAGRLKLLQEKVFGSILADPTLPGHQVDIGLNYFELIDLVIIGFHEISDNVEDLSRGFSIEDIDVGGPMMAWAAAKNFKRVGVVICQTQYSFVLEELERNGSLSMETKRLLAREAFLEISGYAEKVHQLMSVPL